MDNNQKSFSDAWRNPADAGQPFNAQPHGTPQPLDPAKREAACERKQQVIDDAKAKIGGFTESQGRETARHDAYVTYLREKLWELNDNE